MSSMSTFVSCKDYDDDINSLQTQVNSLKDLLDAKETVIKSNSEKIQALQNSLSSLESTLKGQIADGDAATLAAARQAVADAQAALQAALAADKSELVAANAAQDQKILEAKTAADQALAQLKQLSDTMQPLVESITQDIAAAQAGLTQVQLDLADLTTKYNTLSSDLTQAILDIAELKIAVAGQAAALEAIGGQEGLAQVKADVATLLSNLTALQSTVTALNEAQSKAAADIVSINGTLAELKAAQANFASKGELSNLDSEIKALKETTIPALETKIDSIDSKYDTMATALAKALRSLVYMPYLYVDGIESIEYPYLVDYKLKEEKSMAAWTRQRSKGMANGFFYEDYEKTIEEADLKKYPKLLPLRDWVPDATAKDYEEWFSPAWPVQYHMNPSAATTVWGDVKGWNIRKAEIITRSDAADQCLINVTDKYVDGTQLFKNDKGVLTVGLIVENAKLLANHGTPLEADGRPGKTHEDNTTGGLQYDDIIALQVNSKLYGGLTDTLITSDYAMIYPERAQTEAIVWHTYHSKIGYDKPTFDEKCPMGCTQHGHVWDDPKKALGAGTDCETYPDIELYYDDKEGIALEKLLGIHLYYVDTNTLKDKNNPHLVKFTDPEFGQWGLSYEFQLVGYSIDGNKTVDSNYAEFTDADENGVSKTGTIRARNVLHDGTTIDEESATSVDREPLVRVLVKRGNRVLHDGYILIHITKKQSSTTVVEYPEQKAEFDLCNDITVFHTDWSQFSYYMLTQHLNNMTKEQFDAQYGTNDDPGVPDRMYTTNPIYCENRTGRTSNPVYHGYDAAANWSNSTYNDYWFNQYYVDAEGNSMRYSDNHYRGQQYATYTIQGKREGVAGGMYIYDDIQLYKKDNKGNFVKCTARDLPGYVRYYHNSVGTTNHSFDWIISADELEEMTHDGATLPKDLTYYFRYTGKIGADYDYIYVEMKVNLNRAIIAESGIKNKNTNYWYHYVEGDGGYDGVVWNPWYPRDGKDTRTYSQGLPSTFTSEGGTKNVVNFTETKGLVKGPGADINASLNNHSTGRGLAKYYFVPKEFEFKAQDGKTYIVTPKSRYDDVRWRAFVCKYDWWDNDGTKSILHDGSWHNLHWDAKDATAWLTKHKWTWEDDKDNPQTPEDRKKLHEECAIDYTKGVYTNAVLYAVLKDGKENTKDEQRQRIATLDQNIESGVMTLLHTEFAEKLLNAEGYFPEHGNITTTPTEDKSEGSYTFEKKDFVGMLHCMVGIIAHNGCEVAINVPEYVKDADNVNAGTFYVSWQRPINVAPDADPMVDAKNNGDYIYTVDFLKLFDWRGPVEGKMWGDNQWLWAYYNIKSLTIDLNPEKMKTNMHQADGKFVEMSKVTTQAKFTILKEDGTTVSGKYEFKLATKLAGKNQAAANANLLRAMGLQPANNIIKQEFAGGIKYENNGDNVKEFDIIVPVTVSYDWGEFIAYVKIHIDRTLGN